MSAFSLPIPPASLAADLHRLTERSATACTKCKPIPSAHGLSPVTFSAQVRLAFHPYPQVIPEFFNIHGFGPPAGVTQPSTCSWIDHLVSGRHATYLFALFRLAFAAPTPNGLSLHGT